MIFVMRVENSFYIIILRQFSRMFMKEINGSGLEYKILIGE